MLALARRAQARWRGSKGGDDALGAVEDGRQLKMDAEHPNDHEDEPVLGGVSQLEEFYSGIEGTKNVRRIIYSMIALINVNTVMFKWFVAVLIRKIFVWLEERFLNGPGLLGQPASKFWMAVFMDQVDFFVVLALCFASGFVGAFAATMLRALPLRLAGAYARARRARLVSIALNSIALAEQDNNPTYLLEQISLLSYFEANTKYLRAAGKIRIMLVTIACFVFFWQGSILGLMFFVGIAGFQFSLRNKLLQSSAERRVELLGIIHDSIVDVLRGADVVATHNMEAREMQVLADKETTGAALDREMSRLLVLVGFPELFLLALMIPCILLLARLMLEANDEASDAVNMLFALTAMFFVFDEGHKSLLHLIETNPQATAYAQALRVVNNALFESPIQGNPERQAGDEDDEGDNVGVVPGPIVFQDVTVTYPQASTPAVRDVTFEIPQSTTVAVVAESGGGKTTLFRVASSLVNHQAGSVMFGPVALNDLTKHAVRARMGYVSQDSMLFSRSIRENIWYGNECEPDDDMIWAVLGQLGLDVWAQGLDGQLDAVLASERMVSGGQAQRLQIARLLCRKGLYFVLLDECMSALDPVMRSVVTRSLKAFLRDKTTMVITHSHDTVSDLCDQVVDLGKLQRNEDRAILPAREYLTSLQRVKKSARPFWQSIFTSHDDSE